MHKNTHTQKKRIYIRANRYLILCQRVQIYSPVMYLGARLQHFLMLAKISRDQCLKEDVSQTTIESEFLWISADIKTKWFTTATTTTTAAASTATTIPHSPVPGVAPNKWRLKSAVPRPLRIRHPGGTAVLDQFFCRNQK